MIPAPQMRDRVVALLGGIEVEAYVVGHSAPGGVALVDLMVVSDRRIELNVKASAVVDIIERGALKLAGGRT